MRRCGLWVIAGWLLSSGAAMAETPAAFRFWRAIERDGATAESIIAFDLDSTIYSATRDGLPDLRVMDDADAEVPYQVQQAAERVEDRSRTMFSTETVSLHEEGTALEIYLRLPEKSPSAEGLSFSTPMRDYERKVHVAGSNDGRQWTPLVADGMIFDYSRYMDVSNCDVQLPANDFRQFKVTFEGVVDQMESPRRELARSFRGNQEIQRLERTTVDRRTLRIDRISAWHTVLREHIRQLKREVYPAAGFEVQEDAAKKQTIVEVRTQREPFTSLSLETSSRNFSRKAVVEVKRSDAGTTQWQPIAEGNIFNFHFRKFQREQLAVSFREQRHETYRIVIHNQDNPPLVIRGVRPEGNVHRVEFLAAPGKSYRVFYGAEDVQTPKYEAATVLAALPGRDSPSMATLGPAVENAAFAGGPGLSAHRLLDNWIFLGAVLAFMVVVLGWGLVSAGRRLEQSSEQDRADATHR